MSEYEQMGAKLMSIIDQEGAKEKKWARKSKEEQKKKITRWGNSKTKKRKKQNEQIRVM